MSKPLRIQSVILGGVLGVALSACTQLTDTHGYAPTDGDLAEIEVGRDTRSTVEAIVGEPGVTGLLNDGGWYYVKSEFRQYGWREPEEISRTVVAILFDEEGRVANIERFGIQDGQIVALSRRVTDDNTTGVSFLQQLFGSIGNFDPGSFLGGG